MQESVSMWYINAQAATSRYSYCRLTILQSTRLQKASNNSAIGYTNNSSGQPFVVSISQNHPTHRTDFTFRCGLRSFGSLSGDAVYTFPLFDRMGSIDLLNSSSSIIMLVSNFSFSKPILSSQAGRRCRESGWWRCAVRCAPDSVAPRPVRKLAQRGAEETQQAQNHFPRAFQHSSNERRHCALYWTCVMNHWVPKVLRVKYWLNKLAFYRHVIECDYYTACKAFLLTAPKLIFIYIKGLLFVKFF